MRQMVCGQVEDFAKKKDDDKVTSERFTQMAEEYGIDKELLDRFRSK
jgi:hypothetical protein